MKVFKIVFEKIFHLKYWKTAIIDTKNNEIKIKKTVNIDNDFIYVADPFLLNDIIYFEGLSLNFKRGKIFGYNEKKLFKINFSRKFSKFHMSFPFVFEKLGKKYMLPQISKINKLILFEVDNNKNAKEFKTIIDNGEFRDSIIHQHLDYYILFTTKKEKKTSIFKAFKLDDKFNLIEEIQLSSKTMNFRCAGKIFNKKSKFFIPIQKSKPKYGSGVLIYELKIQDKKIEFSYIKEVDFKIQLRNVTGFHTYNFINKDEFIVDYRIEKFNIFSIFYKIKFLIDKVL